VKLGITTVEILPAAAWVDERHLRKLSLSNYWGYNPIAFMAPDPRLAPGGSSEIQKTVDALHAASIEVILDVVLNHTGEGDEFGPTLSFRGLDNASYYRLKGDDQRHYIDDAGCGNCLALDRLPVVRFATDVLRSWANLTGIDGFRFDLATAMGRRDWGFDKAAPLFAAIVQDPLLRELKMIAEPWDIGPGGYQLGAFPPTWAEWNDRFRDDVRRFWRGDGVAGDLATRFSGSSDVFGPVRPPSRSINYLTSHDGMTLTDLVSYEHKHNEANGEQNRDGTNNNISWNCGVEGPSEDPKIIAARKRDQRAMLATLLVSRGTPMLAMGSELAQSQLGNNNAYAQDSAISWLNWKTADAGLTAFARDLIKLRRAHAVLRSDRWLVGGPIDDSGIADVDWRDSSGAPTSAEEWQRADFATLVIALAGVGGSSEMDRLAIVVHRGFEAAGVTLPEPQTGRIWQRQINSADETDWLSPMNVRSDTITVGARSVCVLVEVPATHASCIQRDNIDEDLLNAVSSAAGIALAWWDIGGGHHVVQSDTKRALLASMGLAAETNSQARESLYRISAERDPIGLPPAFSSVAGVPFELPLKLERPMATATSLRIEREDGGIDIVQLRAGEGRHAAKLGVGGRPQEIQLLPMPALPAGRHRIIWEGMEGGPCALTCAPKTCFLPSALRDAGKLFGIAAQLYALRRPGDQGIGDFTTLARFAERAAAQGAQTLAVNPLHALFPLERERASPYQPSDRRFLDPIYIDVQSLSDRPLPEAEISVLSQLKHVDYSRVWRLKRQILWAKFAANEEFLAGQDAVARDYQCFVAEGGSELRNFACFEFLSDAFGARNKGQWPAALQRADSPEVEAFGRVHERDLHFYFFTQWLADRQLGNAASRLKQAGLTLGLYRDLALGAAPDGAETWANAGAFLHGVSIGAPPDPFSADGQVWHLPPLNPLSLQSTAHRAFWQPLRANMRHAGVLRIDHVLGLSRLFCIPDGGKARDGTYIAFPLDDLIGQLKLESVRHECAVVGEDLGTVPAGLRDKLAEADVLSYRVLWFERDNSTFRAPASYPSKAAACVSTHDLPTLSGWWIGEDIEERHCLHQLTDEARDRALADRALEKEKLILALQGAGLADPDVLAEAVMAPSLVAAIHAFIGSTPCSIVLAQAEDLAGEVTAVNLPGTDRERPNWRRKLNATSDALFEMEAARLSLARLRALRPSQFLTKKQGGKDDAKVD
jgi:glycogen debranching enzyme GlgX/4-alpha-glucanotransferase